MYNPGRNKTLAYFYDRRKELVRDPKTGEKRQQEKLICKDWVELVPITGRQFLEQRKESNEISYRLRMRYRKEIAIDDIVHIRDQKCEITYISVAPTRRYMELVVKWRED